MVNELLKVINVKVFGHLSVVGKSSSDEIIG
jgi:hypothetical protein